MAFETFPGPELYAARARSQSLKLLFKLLRYLAAASVDKSGSERSSTYELTSKPNIFPVAYMNCQRPVAPTLDFAKGLRADSTIARYFNSKGRSWRSSSSSNIGK